jgi:hypothetical protein
MARTRIDDPAFMTYLYPDGIKIDNRINFIQREVLPQQYLLTDGSGNLEN